MSQNPPPGQDPYQEYSNVPQDPYGGAPDPYAAQQNPYSYNAQQIPNDAPPQNPYGVPPQNPYNTPYSVPPQNPYDIPQGTGYGGVGQQQQQYGYMPPTGSPRPLGQAIRELPGQYAKVLTKPSPITLAEEMGKASWDITWVQLLISAVASAIFGYLATLALPERYNIITKSGTYYFSTSLTNAINVGTSIGSIILVPLFFFIGVGIFYALAKAFGGQGNFLRQGYTTLLWDVPLGIIASLIAIIPTVGGLIALAILIYRIVLHVFTIMAVHRLSGGKATAVVLIPVGIVFVITCALVVVAVIGIAAALNGQ